MFQLIHTNVGVRVSVRSKGLERVLYFFLLLYYKYNHYKIMFTRRRICMNPVYVTITNVFIRQVV